MLEDAGVERFFANLDLRTWAKVKGKLDHLLGEAPRWLAPRRDNLLVSI